MQRRRRRRTYITENNNQVNLPAFASDDFEECMAAFLVTLKTRNRSPHTIKFYRDKLLVLRGVLEDQDLPTRLSRITREIIEINFIKYSLDVKRVKYTTVSTCLRAYRSFFNWAVERGILTESPMDGIVIKTEKPTVVETYTREQIREILRQPNLETFVGFRDYTIMVILLETGIRVRELTDIKLEDVRWQDSQILINGKNGKKRLVPFQKNARNVLRKYVKIRGESPSEYLFITQDDEKMSIRGVQDRIEKYGRMANITNVRNSPHTFRHTFAKMSVQNGANIFDLQKILGHETLEMVKVYVNLFSNEVAESHRKFSPIENLF